MPDSQLIWRFRPGSAIQGQTINSLGFSEREVKPLPDEGTIRVICMGDSCAAAGIPTYATLLHELLANAPLSGQTWEAFHTAVHGYSIVQGRRLFKITTKALKPAFVTICFGWNDHWRVDHPDSLRLASINAGPLAKFLNRLQKKRFYQFLCSRMSRPPAPARKGNHKRFRTPPDQYRTTLRQFIEDVRAAGATPILITAPHANRIHPLILTRTNHASLESVVEAHKRYTQITREVAEKSKAACVDLAAVIETHASRAELFQADGLHLSDRGRAFAARALYEKLRVIGGRPEWR